MYGSPVIARGLELLIESSGGEAMLHVWQGSDALTQILQTEQPELVLIDPQIAGMNVEQVMRSVAKMDESAAVAMISTEESSAHMEEAVSAEVQGFVSLNAGAQDFIASLRLLAEGHVVAIGPDVGSLADVASEIHSHADSTSTLTARESDITVLVAEGLTNKELGIRLFLTEGTVKVHIRNIFRKLGMSHRSELVAHAHRTGLVE